MKRGDVYLSEIKECRSDGLMVNVEGVDYFLPASEIKGGIKQKHKKMVGWFIPVRVKSLRPFAISNTRIDKTKLMAMGLSDVKPIEKIDGKAIPTSTQTGQVKENVSDDKKTKVQEPKIKKIELTCGPLLNGIMAYWNKIENAAIYYVHLLIEEKQKVRQIVAGRATSNWIDKETCKEIATIEVERNIAYYSFLNLAKIENNASNSNSGYYNRGYYNEGNQSETHYYIYVESENRMGDTIAKSDKVLGQVYVIRNGC